MPNKKLTATTKTIYPFCPVPDSICLDLFEVSLDPDTHLEKSKAFLEILLHAMKFAQANTFLEADSTFNIVRLAAILVC